MENGDFFSSWFTYSLNGDFPNGKWDRQWVMGILPSDSTDLTIKDGILMV